MKKFKVTRKRATYLFGQIRRRGFTEEGVALIDRVWITPDEHYAWLARWEERTGRCGACAGVGLVVIEQAGRGEAKPKVGNRLCVRCNGDGQRPGSVADAQAERRRA